MADDFDLYSDLIAEEPEQNDSNNNGSEPEKLQYQKVVTDCISAATDLQQEQDRLASENDTLKKQNITLKRNVSALFKTAKAELARKEKEIADLKRRVLMSGGRKPRAPPPRPRAPPPPQVATVQSETKIRVLSPDGSPAIVPTVKVEPLDQRKDVFKTLAFTATREPGNDRKVETRTSRDRSPRRGRGRSPVRRSPKDHRGGAPVANASEHNVAPRRSPRRDDKPSSKKSVFARLGKSRREDKSRGRRSRSRSQGRRPRSRSRVQRSRSTSRGRRSRSRSTNRRDRSRRRRTRSPERPSSRSGRTSRTSQTRSRDDVVPKPTARLKSVSVEDNVDLNARMFDMEKSVAELSETVLEPGDDNSCGNSNTGNFGEVFDTAEIPVVSNQSGLKCGTNILAAVRGELDAGEGKTIELVGTNTISNIEQTSDAGRNVSPLDTSIDTDTSVFLTDPARSPIDARNTSDVSMTEVLTMGSGIYSLVSSSRTTNHAFVDQTEPAQSKSDTDMKIGSDSPAKPVNVHVEESSVTEVVCISNRVKASLNSENGPPVCLESSARNESKIYASDTNSSFGNNSLRIDLNTSRKLNSSQPEDMRIDMNTSRELNSSQQEDMRIDMNTSRELNSSQQEDLSLSEVFTIGRENLAENVNHEECILADDLDVAYVCDLETYQSPAKELAVRLNETQKAVDNVNEMDSMRDESGPETKRKNRRSDEGKKLESRKSTRSKSSGKEESRKTADIGELPSEVSTENTIAMEGVSELPNTLLSKIVPTVAEKSCSELIKKVTQVAGVGTEDKDNTGETDPEYLSSPIPGKESIVVADTETESVPSTSDAAETKKTKFSPRVVLRTPKNPRRSSRKRKKTVKVAELEGSALVSKAATGKCKTTKLVVEKSPTKKHHVSEDIVDPEGENFNEEATTALLSAVIGRLNAEEAKQNNSKTSADGSRVTKTSDENVSEEQFELRLEVINCDLDRVDGNATDDKKGNEINESESALPFSDETETKYSKSGQTEARTPSKPTVLKANVSKENKSPGQSVSEKVVTPGRPTKSQKTKEVVTPGRSVNSKKSEKVVTPGRSKKSKNSKEFESPGQAMKSQKSEIVETSGQSTESKKTKEVEVVTPGRSLKSQKSEEVVFPGRSMKSHTSEEVGSPCRSTKSETTKEVVTPGRSVNSKNTKKVMTPCPSMKSKNSKEFESPGQAMKSQKSEIVETSGLSTESKKTKEVEVVTSGQSMKSQKEVDNSSLLEQLGLVTSDDDLESEVNSAEHRSETSNVSFVSGLNKRCGELETRSKSRPGKTDQTTVMNILSSRSSDESENTASVFSSVDTMPLQSTPGQKSTPIVDEIPDPFMSPDPSSAKPDSKPPSAVKTPKSLASLTPLWTATSDLNGPEAAYAFSKALYDRSRGSPSSSVLASGISASPARKSSTDESSKSFTPKRLAHQTRPTPPHRESVKDGDNTGEHKSPLKDGSEPDTLKRVELDVRKKSDSNLRKSFSDPGEGSAEQTVVQEERERTSQPSTSKSEQVFDQSSPKQTKRPVVKKPSRLSKLKKQQTGIQKTGPTPGLVKKPAVPAKNSKFMNMLLGICRSGYFDRPVGNSVSPETMEQKRDAVSTSKKSESQESIGLCGKGDSSLDTLVMTSDHNSTLASRQRGSSTDDVDVLMVSDDDDRLQSELMSEKLTELNECVSCARLLPVQSLVLKSTSHGRSSLDLNNRHVRSQSDSRSVSRHSEHAAGSRSRSGASRYSSASRQSSAASSRNRSRRTSRTSSRSRCSQRSCSSRYTRSTSRSCSSRSASRATSRASSQFSRGPSPSHHCRESTRQARSRSRDEYSSRNSRSPSNRSPLKQSPRTPREQHSEITPKNVVSQSTQTPSKSRTVTSQTLTPRREKSRTLLSTPQRSRTDEHIHSAQTKTSTSRSEVLSQNSGRSSAEVPDTPGKHLNLFSPDYLTDEARETLTSKRASNLQTGASWKKRLADMCKSENTDYSDTDYEPERPVSRESWLNDQISDSDVEVDGDNNGSMAVDTPPRQSGSKESTFIGESRRRRMAACKSCPATPRNKSEGSMFLSPSCKDSRTRHRSRPQNRLSFESGRTKLHSIEDHHTQCRAINCKDCDLNSDKTLRRVKSFNLGPNASTRQGVAHRHSRSGHSSPTRGHLRSPKRKPSLDQKQFDRDHAVYSPERRHSAHGHSPGRGCSAHGHSSSRNHSGHGHSPDRRHSAHGHSPDRKHSFHGYSSSRNHSAHGHSPDRRHSAHGHSPDRRHSAHGHSPDRRHSTHGHSPDRRYSGHGHSPDRKHSAHGHSSGRKHSAHGFSPDRRHSAHAHSPDRRRSTHGPSPHGYSSGKKHSAHGHSPERKHSSHGYSGRNHSAHGHSPDRRHSGHGLSPDRRHSAHGHSPDRRHSGHGLSPDRRHSAHGHSPYRRHSGHRRSPDRRHSAHGHSPDRRHSTHGHSPDRRHSPDGRVDTHASSPYQRHSGHRPIDRHFADEHSPERMTSPPRSSQKRKNTDGLHVSHQLSPDRRRSSRHHSPDREKSDHRHSRGSIRSPHRRSPERSRSPHRPSPDREHSAHGNSPDRVHSAHGNSPERKRSPYQHSPDRGLASQGHSPARDKSPNRHHDHEDEALRLDPSRTGPNVSHSNRNSRENQIMGSPDRESAKRELSFDGISRRSSRSEHRFSLNSRSSSEHRHSIRLVDRSGEQRRSKEDSRKDCKYDNSHELVGDHGEKRGDTPKDDHQHQTDRSAPAPSQPSGEQKLDERNRRLGRGNNASNDHRSRDSNKSVVVEQRPAVEKNDHRSRDSNKSVVVEQRPAVEKNDHRSRDSSKSVVVEQRPAVEKLMKSGNASVKERNANQLRSPQRRPAVEDRGHAADEKPSSSESDGEYASDENLDCLEQELQHLKAELQNMPETGSRTETGSLPETEYFTPDESSRAQSRSHPRSSSPRSRQSPDESPRSRQSPDDVRSPRPTTPARSRSRSMTASVQESPGDKSPGSPRPTDDVLDLFDTATSSPWKMDSVSVKTLPSRTRLPPSSQRGSLPVPCPDAEEGEITSDEDNVEVDAEKKNGSMATDLREKLRRKSSAQRSRSDARPSERRVVNDDRERHRVSPRRSGDYRSPRRRSVSPPDRRRRSPRDGASHVVRRSPERRRPPPSRGEYRPRRSPSPRHELRTPGRRRSPHGRHPRLSPSPSRDHERRRSPRRRHTPEPLTRSNRSPGKPRSTERRQDHWGDTGLWSSRQQPHHHDSSGSRMKEHSNPEQDRPYDSSNRKNPEQNRADSSSRRREQSKPEQNPQNSISRKEPEQNPNRSGERKSTSGQSSTTKTAFKDSTKNSRSAIRQSTSQSVSGESFLLANAGTSAVLNDSISPSTLNTDFKIPKRRRDPSVGQKERTDQAALTVKRRRVEPR